MERTKIKRGELFAYLLFNQKVQFQGYSSTGNEFIVENILNENNLVLRKPLLKYNKTSSIAFDPSRSEGSAGIDLPGCLYYDIPPKTFCKIKTDIAFEIAVGYFGLLKARSGFAERNCLQVFGGVIDQNYRLEILSYYHVNNIFLKGDLYTSLLETSVKQHCT